MSTTLTRRRLHEPRYNTKTNKNSSKSSQNNKKWWKILNIDMSKEMGMKQGKFVEISEKVRDQVSLDVKRAFAFKDNSFSSTYIKCDISDQI